MKDPRGPTRLIKDVLRCGGKCQLVLVCGHTNEVNPIYDYKVGNKSRCFACTQKESKCI
jgi:hypothetical protein